jgi:hypothetical protein
MARGKAKFREQRDRLRRVVVAQVNQRRAERGERPISEADLTNPAIAEAIAEDVGEDVGVLVLQVSQQNEARQQRAAMIADEVVQRIAPQFGSARGGRASQFAARIRSAALEDDPDAAVLYVAHQELAAQDPGGYLAGVARAPKEEIPPWLRLDAITEAAERDPDDFFRRVESGELPEEWLEDAFKNQLRRDREQEESRRHDPAPVEAEPDYSKLSVEELDALLEEEHGRGQPERERDPRSADELDAELTPTPQASFPGGGR